MYLERLQCSNCAHYIPGEAANFAAYTLTPANLVAPLGSLGVMFTLLFSPSILPGERIRLIGTCCALLIVLGDIVVILHAPKANNLQCSISDLKYTEYSSILFAGDPRDQHIFSRVPSGPARSSHLPPFGHRGDGHPCLLRRSETRTQKRHLSRPRLFPGWKHWVGVVGYSCHLAGGDFCDDRDIHFDTALPAPRVSAWP